MGSAGDSSTFAPAEPIRESGAAISDEPGLGKGAGVPRTSPRTPPRTPGTSQLSEVLAAELASLVLAL